MNLLSNFLLVCSLFIFVVGLLLFFHYEYRHCTILKQSKKRHEKIKEKFVLVDGRLTKVEERVGTLEDKIDE
jgi:hypothetical protein